DLGPTADLELGPNVVDVGVDRPLAQDQTLADLAPTANNRTATSRCCSSWTQARASRSHVMAGAKRTPHPGKKRQCFLPEAHRPRGVVFEPGDIAQVAQRKGDPALVAELAEQAERFAKPGRGARRLAAEAGDDAKVVQGHRDQARVPEAPRQTDGFL